MFEHQQLIAQFFGFVSLTLGILSLWQKNDVRLKQFMCGLNCSHTLHFFLLDAYPAMIAAAISALRSALSIKFRSSWMAAIFIALTIMLSYPQIETWTDCFPIMGASMGTLAFFCLKGIKMRFGLLVGMCCWLTNNIIVGSIGGTLLEATLMVVNLKTIYQMWKHSQPAAAL